MKFKIVSMICMGTLTLVALGGCQAGPSAQEGAVLGAGTGAVLGAIVGNQSGDAGEGAIVGALAGAVVGSAIGSAEDRRVADQRHYESQLQMAQARQQRAEREAQRQRQILRGSKIEDSEVLAAKQRAEAAEAELTRILKEQQEALSRSKAIEDYEKRRLKAEQEIKAISGVEG